jgi:hypothetical protein
MPDTLPNVPSEFPFLTSLRDHIFEVLALAITLLGILGYTAGMSFAEGWSEMAGMPASYFEPSIQEAIRLGLSKYWPWLISLIVVVVIVNYIHLLSLWDEISATVKANRQRKKLADAARVERMSSDVACRVLGIANQDWMRLGKRGSGQNYVIKITTDRIRKKKLRTHSVSIALSLLAFLISVVVYFLLRSFFVNVAVSEGRREYLGVYIAVTGKLPPAIEKKSSSDQVLSELACEHKGSLSNLRAVHLPGVIGGSYILRASGSTFYFLNAKGTVLKNFGDSGFMLDETDERPKAKLLQYCASD